MKTDEAKRALSYGKYIALDTESTGFQPNENFSLLLEIGAVKYVNGVVVDRFDELIKPGSKKIPKKYEELTGITNEMVKDCDDYVEVLRRFREWCDTDKFILIMHNAPHDLNFLNYFGEKCGVSFSDPFIDTHPLAKNILGKGYWNKLNSRVKENYKLSTLALFYGVGDENHHRANNDAEVTMKVFNCLRRTAMKKEPRLNLEQYWKYPTAVTKESECADKKIKVVSICPWDKKKRLYVTLSCCTGDEESFSTVFYDFEHRCWEIKESGFPIHTFKNLESEVLNQYGTAEMKYENFNCKKYFRDLFIPSY